MIGALLIFSVTLKHLHLQIKSSCHFVFCENEIGAQREQTAYTTMKLAFNKSTNENRKVGMPVNFFFFLIFIMKYYNILIYYNLSSIKNNL